MWTWIRRLFAPPIFEGDEQKTRAAKILSAIIWFNLLVWILVLFLMPLLPASTRGYPVMALLIGVAITALIALRAGYVEFISQAFTVFLWIMVTLLVAISGGILNPETMGYVIVIMAAGLLSGTRLALVFSGLSFASVLIVYLLETRGLLPNLLVYTPQAILMTVEINIMIASSLLAVALDTLNQALQRACR